VRQKQPNGWGLYDILGNVWEWVADWHGAYPNRLLTDPRGPARGENHVMRGGGWDSDARDCRPTYRNWNASSRRYVNLGVRLARSR